MTLASEIPTINISAFLDPASSPVARSKVVGEVCSACSRYGFLQIVGHGFSLDSQRQILRCCKALFGLPLETKKAVSLKNSPSRHGYEGMREQVLDKTALPDDKEGFYIGREEVEEKGFRKGSNQWPDLPVSLFRTPVEKYYQSMVQLAGSLLKIIAIGLAVPIENIESFTREPAGNLKLLHYPPHLSKDSRQAGVGVHTDFGTLTSVQVPECIVLSPGIGEMPRALPPMMPSRSLWGR